MPNESGDMKFLGNFRKLIDRVAAEPNYKPSNSLLEVAPLNARYAAALSAVEDVAVKLAPNKTAINERQIAYEKLAPLVRRSRNILKSSGASVELLADAETFVRKISGKRKSLPAKENPDTPATEATKSHSASQQSYDNQLGNLRSYIEILKNEPLYTPNETDLKNSSLSSFGDELQSKNNAVSASFVPLSNSRGLRDNLLYTNQDNAANIAALVKAYVKGAFGTTSPLYISIKGLRFERKRGK
jgi:hypothetical protein